MSWIVSLSLVILFELTADIFAKEWSIRGNNLLWIATIVVYIISNVFWLYTLKHGSGLGRGVVIFAVASAIVATIIGIIFYKEVVTKIQLVGMLLGIVSLGFIFWK